MNQICIDTTVKTNLCYFYRKDLGNCAGGESPVSYIRIGMMMSAVKRLRFRFCKPVADKKLHHPFNSECLSLHRLCIAIILGV